MNLTNLFGKQVFALYEGEIVGTVCGAVFNKDFTKISALKMFDSNEDEFEIKFSGIKAMNDCVIITNKEKLALFIDKHKNSPMFKQVITEDALNLGKVIDCIIDNKGVVQQFLTNNNLILQPTKVYLRNNFVYYSKTKLLSKNIHPKKSKVDLNNIKVNILSFDESQSFENFVPSKLQFNTNTILGKVAKNTLFGVNNEIIIRANQTISEKTIEDATRHNRLNQLYFIAI